MNDRSVAKFAIDARCSKMEAFLLDMCWATIFECRFRIKIDPAHRPGPKIDCYSGQTLYIESDTFLPYWLIQK